MKCTNKFFILKTVVLFSIIASILTGCAGTSYQLPYDAYSVHSSFIMENRHEAKKIATFASDLCVVNSNVNESAADMSSASAAALFSLEDNQVLYAKNVHETLYPASLTKVMTALVALKLGNRDDILTASSNVTINEAGAQLAGLKQGDTMTLDQALRILLIYSANDVAIMIAEQYGGSVEGFCQLMNKEALDIGATNCNFLNPNGLSEDEHYITVYDMYLIFREACKYELFKEIISMNSYTTVYHDKNGAEVTFDKNATNWFLTGDATPPVGMTVIGGKTGTTTQAGHCLVLLSSNTAGKSFISVILQASDRATCYQEMAGLLELAVK